VFEVSYSTRERGFLWMLAIVGLFGLNGAFLYGILFRQGALTSALSNPIALAFMAEALVLTGVFAYLLAKWGVSRLHWHWFVLLSLLGGMAFAVPVVLLWSKRETGPDGDVRGPS
jgi:hypothetical protein